MELTLLITLPLIAYSILSLEITGCFSSPVSTTTTEVICHKDFDIRKTLQCTQGDPITRRYFYDTGKSTCSETFACSLGYTETHRTIEECMQACTTTTVENVCTAPSLKHGSVQTLNCGEEKCSVYYSCDHANNFELYPEEYRRGKAIKCHNGTWEEHTVYCAKVNVTVHVDGVETLEPTVDSGREVMLSCEIIGDISPEDYNVTWSFKKDERQNEEILGDSDSEIVIPSLTKAHEGTYICSVSGLINKVVEKTLKITADEQPPSVDYFTANTVHGSWLEGACVCKGYPNVKAIWVIDGQDYNGTEISHSPVHTFNLLYLEPEPGTHDVSCRCQNLYGSATSHVETLETVKRGKRNAETGIISGQLDKFCEHNQDEAAIVTGKVLRQTRSITHLKVDKVLAAHSITNNNMADSIIRVRSNQQRMARNIKYMFKLERTGDSGEHVLSVAVPYVSDIDGIITSYCQ